jgi:hypothetical protein
MSRLTRTRVTELVLRFSISKSHLTGSLFSQMIILLQCVYSSWLNLFHRQVMSTSRSFIIVGLSVSLNSGAKN